MNYEVLRFQKSIDTLWLISTCESRFPLEQISMKMTETKTLSCVWLLAASWTPLSVEFSKQKYWSELPFPSLGGLPGLGIKPASLALASGFFTSRVTWEIQAVSTYTIKDCFSSICTGHKSCNSWPTESECSLCLINLCLTDFFLTVNPWSPFS